MIVQVRCITGDTFPIENDNPDASVLDLKHQIEKSLGVVSHTQRLIFGGKELSDEYSLQSYGVADNSIVQLMVRPAQPVEVAAGEHQADNVAVNIADYFNPGGDGGAPIDHPQRRQDYDRLDENANSIAVLSSSVKLFVIVDTATTWFTIFTLQVTYIPLLIAAVIGPITGAIGARFLRVDYLGIYALYILTNIVVRCIYVVGVASARPVDVASELVQMFMEFLILAAVVKLAHGIRQQPAHDLYLLRRGLHPCQLQACLSPCRTGLRHLLIFHPTIVDCTDVDPPVTTAVTW